MFERMLPPFPGPSLPSSFPAAAPSAGAVPPGTIVAFAGDIDAPVSSPPDSNTQPPIVDSQHAIPVIEAWGWMVCDGRPLDVSTYPNLFAVLGYRYGGSDTTFYLPDLRGQFLRGAAVNSEQDPDYENRTLPDGTKGNYIGSVQTDALQTHEHWYQLPKPEMLGESKALVSGPNTTSTLTTRGPQPPQKSPPSRVNVSTYETRPKNISVHYLIKFF